MADRLGKPSGGSAGGSGEPPGRPEPLGSGEPPGRPEPLGSGEPLDRGEPLDQAANLLGALSLVVADRMADAMTDAGGRSETGSAALCALLHFLDRPSVDRLRQVLGLTPSGTVRLVDRLAESGYVSRGPGGDGRSVSVSLTEVGRAAAARVAGSRAGVLAAALAALSPAERRAFRVMAGKMLAGMMRPPGATRWICRLCDTPACHGAPGGCPFVNAARERHLPSGEHW